MQRDSGQVSEQEREREDKRGVSESQVVKEELERAREGGRSQIGASVCAVKLRIVYR